MNLFAICYCNTSEASFKVVVVTGGEWQLFLVFIILASLMRKYSTNTTIGLLTNHCHFELEVRGTAGSQSERVLLARAHYSCIQKRLSKTFWSRQGLTISLTGPSRNHNRVDAFFESQIEILRQTQIFRRSIRITASQDYCCDSPS